MLRIFLILSLAVALAGLGFSFVLKDKVQSLTEQRDTFHRDRDTATAEASRAQEAEKKAVAAEKAAKDELTTTQEELAATSARLNDTEGQLAKRSQELEETKVARDTASRKLARWDALSIEPDAIANLQTRAQRLLEERDAFAEEKKVMGREISRLTDELRLYRGEISEVQMADVHGRITQVDGNYNFVVLNVGGEDGLKKNGKMIVTRGDKLVAKVQLVRVEPRSAVANLLPDWAKGDVQAGDQVVTSYEALAK
jgi:hypothetical protein